MRSKYITERQLKNDIRWFLMMHTWEFTDKAIEKTERVKKRLEDYLDGQIKLNPCQPKQGEKGEE